MWTDTIGCVECVGAGGADIDPDMDVSDVIYPPDIPDLPGFSPGLDFRNMQHHIYCFSHVRPPLPDPDPPHTYSAIQDLCLVNHVENTIGYVGGAGLGGVWGLGKPIYTPPIIRVWQADPGPRSKIQTLWNHQIFFHPPDF